MKCRELRQLQALIDEAQAEAETIKDAIKAAMGTKYSGGTNIHAGLLAGKAALEDHQNISPDKKYLV